MMRASTHVSSAQRTAMRPNLKHESVRPPNRWPALTLVPTGQLRRARKFSPRIRGAAEGVDGHAAQARQKARETARGAGGAPEEEDDGAHPGRGTEAGERPQEEAAPAQGRGEAGGVAAKSEGARGGQCEIFGRTVTLVRPPALFLLYSCALLSNNLLARLG